MLKLLFWDQTGICILTEQLDQGNFVFSISDDSQELEIQMSANKLFRIIGGNREP